MIVPQTVFQAERPFFLYRESEIEESVSQVRDFWKEWSLPGFEIFFSIKTNPNPHLLRILAKLVDGFDVSSLTEARLARKTSPNALITWSGPAKTNRAFDEVAKWNLHCFHLDSVDDWLQFRNRFPKEQNHSIRLSSNEIHSQKLGFSKAELQRLRDQQKQLPQGFQPAPAVHSYLGRETFSVSAMTAFFQRLDDAIQQGHLQNSPQIFLGAGLPSRHLLKQSRDQFKPFNKPRFVLNLESGRGLIQSAGSYGTRILSVKKTSSGPSAIIDGGLQHMATHFLSPRYKAEGVEVRFFRQGQELFDRSETVSILGSLSLWHDTMIENIQAPADLQRDDWILASQVGAYGYAAASNQFLGPTPIHEWLLKKDGALVDISAPGLVAYHEASL